MLDNQQKNTDKMFEMYDKANSENREAIKACTEAINKLSDCIEDLGKE
jgi:polyhydroxyalkanoate synthesis regulator phasin